MRFIVGYSTYVGSRKLLVWGCVRGFSLGGSCVLGMLFVTFMSSCFEGVAVFKACMPWCATGQHASVVCRVPLVASCVYVGGLLCVC